MRITVAAIGRAKPGPHRELYALYSKRCGWQITLKELVARKKPGDSAEEAALLLDAVPPGAALFALDERGSDLTSAAFAAVLQAHLEKGQREFAFVIGGADGLHATLRQRADRLVAFGRATWPHMLVRAMLAEQLYRAETILSGHPYHRA
ncbi:MAG: 23S rRNA (pseudouridine(1915)-N(3))-methyltransferase RlmH [Geminicoccaceae bacterium]